MERKFCIKAQDGDQVNLICNEIVNADVASFLYTCLCQRYKDDWFMLEPMAMIINGVGEKKESEETEVISEEDTEVID